MEVTEYDEAVYRIIGKNSKVLDGLNVLESSGSSECISPTEKENEPPFASTSSQVATRKRSHSKTGEADENATHKQQLKSDWFDLSNRAQGFAIER